MGLVAVLTMGVLALLFNVFERKTESKNPFFRVVELDDTIEDPSIWGKNFPLQYDGYKRTVDMERTRFGGSEAIRHVISDQDPRDIVTSSKLDDDLKTMWAGYAFAVDFREERGHAYMLEDQMFTQRQVVVKQPGTCLNCHASVYNAYLKLGNGDIHKGFHALNAMPYEQAKDMVKHPVTCVDCHDSKTMQLRITRPAFMEGIKHVKALEGIKDYDVNTMATRQEMRSYVCGQCHVEYYFKGKEKTLTYPWSKGLKATDILSYYDETSHKDWVHKISGAEVLKAQHPEFELWSQGIHARSGVSCADCHMPYKREGALKISDHHVRSPMLNVAGACQTCHHYPEKEIKARVERIQENTFYTRNLAMKALKELIHEIARKKDDVRYKDQVKKAQDHQKRAQFLLDFVEAENSTGFHAPQESVKVLAQSIDYSRQGQNALK